MAGEIYIAKENTSQEIKNLVNGSMIARGYLPTSGTNTIANISGKGKLESITIHGTGSGNITVTIDGTQVFNDSLLQFQEFDLLFNSSLIISSAQSQYSFGVYVKYKLL
jgi:hypothetical protein